MKKALLQMHLAVLLWGFTGVLGKAITLDAPVLVWYRMLLTALLMACFLTYRKQWVKVMRGDLLQLAYVGLLMGLHWVAFYAAIKLSNASIALVCLSTTPVFTTLFHQFFHREKYKPKELLLGVIALAGMFLIYQFQKLYVEGIIAGIMAALLAAWFTVLNKRIAHKYPARTMVFYEMSTGWVFISVLLPVYLFYYPQTTLLPQQDSLLSFFQFSGSSRHDWIWLIVLALCCTVWAQSLALNALKKISSFTATLSVNLEPVYGIILAFLFYHENQELHPGFFIGMALILVSVLLQMMSLLRSKSDIRDKGGLD